MSTKVLSAVGLVAMTMMLAVGACSSSDDGGNPGTAGAAGHPASGGSGGGSGDTSAPCYAYCLARETKKDCSASSTVEDCTGYTFGCSDFTTRSAACKTALMAYWSCTAAQADPCVNPGSCGTQGDTVATACAN